MNVDKIIFSIINKKTNKEDVEKFRLKANDSQQNVIQILGKRKIKQGIPFVLEALKNNDKKILRTAIWSAGKLKIKETTKELQKIFKNIKDEKIRRVIIWTLSKIKGKENLLFFLQLLKDENLCLKKSLYLALVEFGEESILELTGLLKDKDEKIAWRAAEILSKMPGVETKIVPLLKDKNKQIRRMVIYILGQTDHFENMDYLIEALEDEDIGVRKRAIRALGKLKEKKAVSYLVKFLEDKSIDFQRESIKSLSNIGGEEALGSLINIRERVFPQNYNILNKSLLQLGYNLRIKINKEIFDKMERKLDITQFSYLAEVPEGLEGVALADIKNKYFITLKKILPGKIIFDYQDDIRKLRKLKSVKEIYLFLTQIKRGETKEKFLDQLRKIDISPLFSLFKNDKNFSFFLNLRELKNFVQRTELSKALRQWLLEKTLWVSLSHGYNIEFKIFSGDESLFLTLKLIDFLDLRRKWRKSLISTSLEPSLAYLMCVLSNVSDSDIFLDPMCGSGTIIIERTLIGFCKKIIGSDINREAVRFAKNNLNLIKETAEIYQWDAMNLPLEKNSITKVVVNMPYGQRVGSHQANLKLYPLFFKELERIVSVGGTVVILTQEKKLLDNFIKKTKKFLINRRITINIGGLQPDIFILKKI